MGIIQNNNGYEVAISTYYEPNIFNDDNYYFYYQIFADNGTIVASGQDCVESKEEVDKEYLKQYVLNHLTYFFSKPSKYKCGKILRRCFEDCLQNDSGMCFLDVDDMDEYSSDDIDQFIKDVEHYDLFTKGFVEAYDSLEEACNNKGPFAICYGALGDFFDNTDLS